MDEAIPSPSGGTRRNFIYHCGTGLGGIALAALTGPGSLRGAEKAGGRGPVRLGVTGGDAIWRAAGPRLRGATIGPFSRDPAAFDAVIFVEPGRLEPGLVGLCLSEKRPVLIVADAWLTSDILKTLSATAQQSGTPLAVANPDRFLPSRQMIRQHLDEGKLGEPGLVRMHRWEPMPADPRPGFDALPVSLLRDLDLALSLVGQSPDSIYAIERRADESRPASGRSVQVHLGFPGGGMAMIDHANRLPPGDDYVSLSLIASNGAAYADDHRNMQLVYRGGHPQSVRVEEHGRLFTSIAQDFVDGLIAKRDFAPGRKAWDSALAVAGQVQLSLTTGQAINPEAG